MDTETSEPDYIDQTIQAIERAEASRTYGRPSVFTKHKVRKFLEAIERGNFPEPASYYAGLSYRTVRRWLEDGANDETEQSAQWHFRQAVLRASATDEDQAITRLSKAAASHPRFYMADMIRLSRRHRERWAERTADELRQAQAPQVMVIIGQAPPGTPQNPMTLEVKAQNSAIINAPHISDSESLNSAGQLEPVSVQIAPEMDRSRG